MYQTSRTIEVTGAEQSYVTYAAYPGEQVELAGVTTLAPDLFRRLGDVPAGEAKWSSKSRVPAAAAPTSSSTTWARRTSPPEPSTRTASTGNRSPSPPR
ncbi:hypothetical protein ACFQ0B_22755 [Nonomuraea thailandensis]